jgi:NitT/TauT family transport system ATP-binding protein
LIADSTPDTEHQSIPDTEHRQLDKPRLVQVTDVNKRYANGTLALEGINLEVRNGEFISLVGPSGCGKSTLLRIIAGLGDVSDGLVSVNGFAPTSLQAKGSTAFVFQEATLLPWRTVRANVELPLELQGVPKTSWKAVVDETLELVGLEKFDKAFPRELSGGMRMRVSIARALVTKPKLLLMDEPFGALDEITRQKLNADLLRLKDLLGATVIFVTHNVFEAVFLSSRIAVMSTSPGRFVREIAVKASYPRDAGFRGSPEFGQGVLEVVNALEH